MKKITIRWKSLSLPLALMLAGAFVLLTFNWTLEVTSSEPFCISCHEMRENAWPELQETIHFSNSSGSRADCADCHVPHDTFGKIARKIEALRELYGKMTGIVDTPEKYEAHRQVMAERVWEKMRNNDSLACRTCHVNQESILDEQYQWARQEHQRGIREDLTCIDCHQGIAHRLPRTELMVKPLPTALVAD